MNRNPLSSPNKLAWMRRHLSKRKLVVVLGIILSIVGITHVTIRNHRKHLRKLVNEKKTHFEKCQYFDPTANKNGDRSGDGDGTKAEYTPPLEHKSARFFIFQKDGNQELVDQLLYYSSVVPHDSIVVLDHQGGGDPSTERTLKQYADLGSHIWKCPAHFSYKGKMLTDVMRKYANHSDFVFPVDVDEYLAVIKEDENGGRTLTWNKEDLEGELKRLGNIDMGESTKQFKTLHGYARPAECPSLEDNSKSSNTASNSFYAKRCNFDSLVLRRHNTCNDKTFTKGVNFHETDQGNHHGSTRERNVDAFTRECRLTKAENGQPNESVYIKSGFALLHLSDLEFVDWVMHALRGASAYSYNNIQDPDYCTGRKGGSHYCKSWKKYVSVDFSHSTLRKMYLDEKCGVLDRYEVLPKSDVFAALCR